MNVSGYLKTTFGYTDFQIGQIRYTVMSILSEVSKLMIIGGFFLLADRFLVFLTAALLLCLLRTCTGGLHFKHYISCFLVSFCILSACVFLPAWVPVNRNLMLILSGGCALCNYRLAPVVSSYRPTPSEALVRKSRRQSAGIILFYTVLALFLPFNQYIVTGFWTILLHSIQLAAAKIWKRRDTA
ncbi:MAG: accessory gene regulator B family protein [Lachnospiraceae bacterium]|nr:accessory gene regulator B family protein [Lachnospiraceae bacterium]